MKKLSVLMAMFGFISSVSAADITLYYSPSCPHCHHVREFISSTLVYEYPDINVTAVNVMQPEHRQLFENALAGCKYDNGGVPVLVIGEKCFQGYADFMQDDLRNAVEADMSSQAKAAAAKNKQSLSENAEEFKTQHTERASVITEYSDVERVDVKKNDRVFDWAVYGLLILMVVALGVVLIRKGKQK